MIGEKLGSFRIDAVLGTGAMGVVYRATNEVTGRPAAVKVINGEFAKQGKAYERFRREAEILQQFRHPNIVRFLALGRYQGTSYFAMEYVAGDTLEHLLARRGPLPWREVIDLAIQTCEALHYAHEHGVVHRDLKPSNLMVTDQGQVKLTDFGIAKDLDATALTAPGRTLGTAAYMAPEQIRGTPDVSHKTDLYSLGIVLYQMLTGQAAFTGTSAVVLMHCHLNQPPPRPGAKVPDIPRALDDLIVNLMGKSPADRPWDAAAAGLKLTELRDKVEKGQKVPLAFPGATQDAHPTRAGLDAPGMKAKQVEAKGPGRIAMSRAAVETASLVLALVAVGAGIAYIVWPPSANYLYHQAERLMASPHRHDWQTAQADYLDPLDRRFPEHPYRATTRAWRDRVALDVAEGRSKVLDSSPIPTPFNQPKTDGERYYLSSSNLARMDTERGDELAAAERWLAMGGQIKRDDPIDGKWHLLALKRAADLKKAVADRRAFVAGQCKQIDAAVRAGRYDDAAAIRDDLLARYGKYADLDDLLGPSPVTTPDADPRPSPTQAVPPQADPAGWPPAAESAAP